MKSFIRFSVAVVAVTVASSSLCYAGIGAPEIDPGMGAGALALLGGTIMVIRGRKR